MCSFLRSLLIPHLSAAGLLMLTPVFVPSLRTVKIAEKSLNSVMSERKVVSYVGRQYMRG